MPSLFVSITISSHLKKNISPKERKLFFFLYPKQPLSSALGNGSNGYTCLVHSLRNTTPYCFRRKVVTGNNFASVEILLQFSIVYTSLIQSTIRSVDRVQSAFYYNRVQLAFYQSRPRFFQSVPDRVLAHAGRILLETSNTSN